MGKDLSADELRALVKSKFDVEIEGQVYRVDFTFEDGHHMYRRIIDAPPPASPLPPKHRNTLVVYDSAVGAAPDTEDIATEEGLRMAFRSLKVLNKYKLEALIDGVVVGRFTPNSR